MKTIKDLQPSIVWNNFYKLTQIPRPSSHEEKVSEYLYSWGKEHGIETVRVEVGNIIMKKPATPGYENRKTVVMQGHMDMVPAKTTDSDHDFLKDPIKTIIDGDWVTADRTTLGADNGIGVALALSVMEDDSLEHGPLELLCTVDEEQGMVGARNLSPDVLKAEILLNLDEEEDGALCVGCAGGTNFTAVKEYKSVTTLPEGFSLYEIKADKGEGGHSGQDIPLGRINANKSVARVLITRLEDYGCKLVSMKGGTLRNAIPINCEALVLVPELTRKSAEAAVATIIEDILNEHKISDPVAEMSFTPKTADVTEYVPDGEALAFVRALLACPHGAERMSELIPGLTETSTNMALVGIGDGKFFVKCMTRSSVDAAKDTLLLRQKAIFDLIGAETTTDGSYNGWKPNDKSDILKVCKEVYNKLHGKEIKVSATHGGLECGIFTSKYPNMDMIAFGPTIMYPHSPAEKLCISTVASTWEYLREVLKNIPTK